MEGANELSQVAFLVGPGAEIASVDNRKATGEVTEGDALPS